MAPHLTQGHLPNNRTEQCLQEPGHAAPAGAWDAALADTWGPDLPGSTYTTENTAPPTLNQKRLSSIGRLEGTAWPGQGPGGPTGWGPTYTCAEL